ncbi:hypothetical protein [Rhizomonospora bruguierae]|uniref:hypothetical protein n=1 Tax=Rhizomonospora bruguierae TaxID=1581705 RepID=UPI001BCDE25A|nr:hypothetical protein [Micromonospora sp. NBRC 107566]
MDRVLAICGLIVAVGAAAEVLRRVVGWVIGTMRRLGRLADDLLGEPARGDQPARPGLMDRVAGMDRRLAAVEQLVHQELTHNGGSSMKDQVTQVARATGADQH